MDYKEKLKEALNSDNTDYEVVRWIEQNFPELKESEDERIRKELLNYLYDVHDDDEERVRWIAWLEKKDATHYLTVEDIEDVVKGALMGCAISFINYLHAHAFDGKMRVSNKEYEDIENAFQNSMWDRLHRYYCKYIEKQGGQISDKVEPKFKVGDWISGYYTNYKVLSINNKGYVVEDADGNKINILFENEKFHHLWTIQDAKGGDVLVCKGNIKYSNGVKYERICLFNNLDNAFFTLTKTSNYIEEYGIDVNIDYPDNTVPATKEQKEILFMVMKDVGYEWDDEKKELKEKK